MRIRLFVATLAALSAAPIAAQVTPEQFEAATRALRFREIGPTIMSGRVADLAVVESDPRIYYVATATGGLWKTQNAGTTYEAVFFDAETASIGDVTVAPSNPNVVWVGTGEPQNRQSSPWGNGVYRSVDAGQNWTHLGLEATHHISRIAVHPMNPDVAYVAAMGHLWGPNPERGVYKTTDGGQSWSLVLHIDEHTGAIDLAMDPNDPQTLFAAMYQRQRRAWGFNGGGPGSGVYRTYDGGATWSELTDGLPTRDKGRIGLSIYRRDGDIVCAIVEADASGSDAPDQNGVYCSTDRGDSWEMRSDNNNRPMYYSQIRIDPNDPERIYTGGSSMFRSSDGGRTFTPDAAAGVHLDHHAIWIDPADSDHVIIAGDGGVSVSWDRSDNWYQHRNLPISQFYEIGVDMRDPYHVCGGLQDNGSWCAPSDTWSNQGIRTRDWYNVGSGDGFFTVMHPTDPGVMLAESQGGNIRRVDLNTMERAAIRPMERPDATGEAPDYRYNWDSPIVISAHDANTVYFGSNVLFKSTDLGQSWDAISGDLTYAVDRDTLHIMGVPGAEPQMSRNDGQSTYGNLTAIGESPVDRMVVYTGADDGRLHVTRDGGGNWTDITSNVDGLPPYTYVTRIVASHGDAGTVYAAFDGHRSDDFEAYVYRSTNFGEDWTRISEGLPATSVNALAQHPERADLLFVGNEVGVYASVDGGARWMRLKNGLPTVPVDDIKIHPRENDLVLGTHGRGIWIMDDIAPLQELTARVVAAAAHLFEIRRATSYNTYTPQGWTPGIWEADNPPLGARIRYWLGEGTEVESLTVKDATGATVRELNALPGPGIREIVWDLRMQAEGADGERMSPGPRVMPGTYLVELAAGDQVIQGEVTVRLDPRTSMTRPVIAARHAAMMDSYRLSGPMGEVGQAMDAVEERADEIEDMIEASDADDSAVAGALQALRDRMQQMEEDFDDLGAGAGAWRSIEGFSGPPTADQLWAIDHDWGRMPDAVAAVNALLENEVATLYALAYQPDLRPEVPEPVQMPRR